MRIIVTVENLEKIRGAFNQLGVSVNGNVIDAVQWSAIAIEEDAKALVPVLTGELQGTIRHQIYRGGFAARIMAGYGQLARAGGRARRDKQGNPINAGKGAYAPIVEFGSKRSKAQPFLFPALEAERPHFIAAVNDALGHAVRDAERA